MGYRTYHTLTVFDLNMVELPEDVQDKHSEEIEETTGACFTDECKWYEHTEEMAEYSKKYPDCIFKIHGEGEDFGDLWDEYFLNGKHQSCPAQIYYPKFDMEKLVEL